MISWMQKNNRYLVWTIWIATIAFIGAGFVGWGSFNFGSKATNVATVGDIEIKQSKLNRSYSNLYNQYNEMLGGTLDEARAKEMGLVQQAFSNLAIQAKILNFAQDMGIIVSDEELVMKRREFKAFQKDGKFNRELYNAYLQNSRQKAKDFEAALREDIIINKTLKLFQTSILPLEHKVILSAMGISDKLLFKVLGKEDVNITIDSEKLKLFWEEKKAQYMTEKRYNLSLLWTPNNQDIVSQKALKEHYNANSFRYTNSEGKQLSFEDATEQVIKDIKLKKSKKTAQKAYIALKKGKTDGLETLDLNLHDSRLTQAIWTEIENKSIGDILKPKIASGQYVTIKINTMTPPTIMSFEEAKERVTSNYLTQEERQALQTLATTTLENLKANHAEVSDFISPQNNFELNGLTTAENKQFSEKLFTSNEEKGIIRVLDKVVVYEILEQKNVPIMDENQTKNLKNSLTQMKERTFESNFLKILDEKYPTEVYMEGLIN